MVLLVKGRVPGGDRSGMLDALVVAVGVGLVAWIYIMSPIVQDASQTAGEIAVGLAYPVLDLLLLTVMARLLLAPGRRVTAYKLAMGALLALILADFPYAYLSLSGQYQTGQLVDGGWLVSSACWAAMALHPSMRTVATPVELVEIRFTAWRLVLLAGASLIAPAVLVIQAASGAPIDVPVIAGASVLLFLLVVARLGGLVSDLHSTLTKRKELEAELERRALHDPLTGLANRTLFNDRLENSLRRRRGRVAVMFLDLDDFKTVNDSLGHAAGDALLCSVANALTSTLRPSDTVARLGGDEFAVLLDDDPDAAAASATAQRLLAALEVPAAMAGQEYAIGASIGISLGAPGARSAMEMMRDADTAMYVAKSQGKGRFTVFEQSAHSAVVRGLELRADLDQAIRGHQFELHYQPILDLTTLEVVGMEALVRWRHPARGLLVPAEFIALAERTGAIVPLGRWILEEACSQAAAWIDAGACDDRWTISVNLSGVQLADPDLAAVVLGVLTKCGLSANRLVLEVTETALIDHGIASDIFTALRARGVQLAIDDFGTGYASLAQLAQIPFDIVKLDRSFVASLGGQSRVEVVAAGIVDLSRRLDSALIAEGIEDGEQLAILQDLGCALGQGYYFAQPLPAADAEAFMRQVPPPHGLKPRLGHPVVPSPPNASAA
jgi:diguanylate cyclase (GGDEF)-like protein